MLTLIVSTRNHCIQSSGLRGAFNNDTLMFETIMEERRLALDEIILSWSGAWPRCSSPGYVSSLKAEDDPSRQHRPSLIPVIMTGPNVSRPYC